MLHDLMYPCFSLKSTCPFLLKKKKRKKEKETKKAKFQEFLYHKSFLDLFVNTSTATICTWRGGVKTSVGSQTFKMLLFSQKKIHLFHYLSINCPVHKPYLTQRLWLFFSSFKHNPNHSHFLVISTRNFLKSE